jgi:hypothetical protein
LPLKNIKKLQKLPLNIGSLDGIDIVPLYAIGDYIGTLD